MLKSQSAGELVNLHRVIDYQITGNQRVDPIRIASHADHGTAQGCQIDNCRNTGKVLKDNATREEGEFQRGWGRRFPVCKIRNVFGIDDESVDVAKNRFQQDTDGICLLYTSDAADE